MCAMRRQYSGEVKYCWPASCWPAATSHRRNSAFRRPSLWRVTRPATSACALICFQFWNCGAASMLVMRSIKAAGSIGANSPLRRRLLVMTWATPALASPSAGDPGTKVGIAIGSGATLPSVTCNFVWARASDGSNKPAEPRRRSGGRGGQRQWRKRKRRHGHYGLIFKSAAKHRLWIEIDFHVFPGS